MSADEHGGQTPTLDEMRYARSKTPEEERPQCPGCGSVKIDRRLGVAFDGKEGKEYRCENCKHDFDEPERPGGERSDPLDEYRISPMKFPLHVLDEHGEPLCGNLAEKQRRFLEQHGYLRQPTLAEKRGDQPWPIFLGSLCGNCRRSLLAKLDDQDVHEGWETRRELVTDGGTSTRGSESCKVEHQTVAHRHGWDFCPRCGEDMRRVSSKIGGLYGKYAVYKDGEVVEECFVLEPAIDEAARDAILVYSEVTDDERLSQDLIDWMARYRDTGSNRGAR